VQKYKLVYTSTGTALRWVRDNYYCYVAYLTTVVVAAAAAEIHFLPETFPAN